MKGAGTEANRRGVAAEHACEGAGEWGQRKAPGYLAVAGASLTAPFRRHRKGGLALMMLPHLAPLVTAPRRSTSDGA